MKPTHFRPHVERNPLSFSDDPFDSRRLRTSRAGESRSPRAVGNLPAKCSASQDSTNGPTILGVSAESLEGVEVGFGDDLLSHGSHHLCLWSNRSGELHGAKGTSTV